MKRKLTSPDMKPAELSLLAKAFDYTTIAISYRGVLKVLPHDMVARKSPGYTKTPVLITFEDTDRETEKLLGCQWLVIELMNVDHSIVIDVLCVNNRAAARAISEAYKRMRGR